MSKWESLFLKFCCFVLFLASAKGVLTLLPNYIHECYARTEVNSYFYHFSWKISIPTMTLTSEDLDIDGKGKAVHGLTFPHAFGLGSQSTLQNAMSKN